MPFSFQVIVEDADETSNLVKNLINRSGLSHRSVLLHAKTPTDYKLTKKDPHWSKPRLVQLLDNSLIIHTISSLLEASSNEIWPLAGSEEELRENLAMA